MTRYVLIKSLTLIIILLTTQLGNAFVPAEQMQDCGMDMSSSSNQPAEQTMSGMSAMHAQGSETLMSDTMANEMDCCNMDASFACCDTNCQCSSFIIASLLLNTISIHIVIKSQAKPLYNDINNPLAPFLHQPKRPPITAFS